jgi:hypothetical protein
VTGHRIVSERGGERLTAGAEARIELDVKNPGRAPIDFKWKALKGHLAAESTTGPSNIYTAPDSAGLDSIAIELITGSRSISASVPIDVVADVPRALPQRAQLIEFEFPTGTMGWARNEIAQSDALVRIAHVSRIELGERPGALQLDLNLNPQSQRTMAAEVEVNLTHRGEVVSSPLDLSNKTIMYSIRVPADFPIARSAPHGVQPFVRDDAIGTTTAATKTSTSPKSGSRWTSPSSRRRTDRAARIPRNGVRIEASIPRESQSSG